MEEKQMSNGKTGGHWRPCNVGSVEAHNERRPEYLEQVKKAGLNLYFFEHLTKYNTHWVNSAERYQGKTVAEVQKDMAKVYTEKTGQAPQLAVKKKINKKTGRVTKCAGWSPIREMCPPIKKDTKIEDFDFLKKWAAKYGIEIIRIDLHKDEGHRDAKTGEIKPNYHAHVVASFFDWNTGRTVKPDADAMSEMQTVLAEALGMERGERKVDTGVRYLDHRQYRKMMEEIDRGKRKNEELQTAMKKAETKVKALTTMIENLEAEKDALLVKLNETRKVNALETDALLEIRRMIKEVEDKLEDKLSKLKEAEEEVKKLAEKSSTLDAGIAERKEVLEKSTVELRKLNERRHDLQNSYDDLKRQLNRELPDLLDKTQREVNSTMWEEAAPALKRDYNTFLDYAEKFMTPRQFDEFKDIVDSSFFGEVAQRGEEIAGVAAALFLGYIDQATTYAQSSGGGGGGSAAGFARNKDEDDDAYRRRCCIMGRMMMKPAGRIRGRKL